MSDVKSTFNKLGFKIVEKNNSLLINLDKERNIQLKIIEQEKFNHSNEFTNNIRYLLLINKYSKFKFVRIDNTIARRVRYPSFQFSKKLSRNDKNKLNYGIKPNNIQMLNLMFENDNLGIIVDNLKKIMNESITDLTDSQLKKLGDSHSLNIKPDNINSSAKRVLLIVASAAMFHTRLDEHLPTMRPKIDARTGKPFKGNWPPSTLHDCYLSDNCINELQKAWNDILAIDYGPIFETALVALDSCDEVEFNNVIKKIIEWSKDSVDQIAGRKHDVLGRLFHVVLDDAKYDGSYYTSVYAATLLSCLAIQKRDIPDKLGSMKIIDPACGTGTLLMAAAERIRNIAGKKYDAKTLIENVLCGIDINKTALHMAATTIGLISPDTKFKQMNIQKIDLDYKDGLASAGSLELYSDGGILPYFDWAGNSGTIQIDSKKKIASYGNKFDADLVIMNPPFTRNDHRHHQLDKLTKDMVKKREKDLFKNISFKIDYSSSGILFLILAEKICKANGTIACVFPLSIATAPSASGLRDFLACRFHIEYIISSHHPSRFWFSENTNIAETLIVMRRKHKKNARLPTRVVNLSDPPQSASGAESLSKIILSKNNGHFNNDDINIIDMPENLIQNGDWHGVQFFAPQLSKIFFDIREGNLFKTKFLNDVAYVEPSGRHLTSYVKQTNKPDARKWASIYEHKTNEIISIENNPYTFIVPKTGKLNGAKQYWDARTHFLVPVSFQPNLTHVAAIYSPTKTLGQAWQSVRPRGIDPDTDDEKRWGKAMAVYFNSTLGIISMLGSRIPRKPLFPRFSVENHQCIPVPEFNEKIIDILVRAYDQDATNELGRWAIYQDPVRIRLDRAMSRAFDIDYEVISAARKYLSQEPMCKSS